MSIDNIVSGFRATGIYPSNKEVIPLYAYAPSLPTYRPPETTTAQNTENNIQEWEAEDYIPLALLQATARKIEQIRLPIHLHNT
ncbi:unnamed protein product [Acanthoscelides obtectus]|uniref:Uncharacterized protein n=1 Tax=Acanthoscelides obtectus TaxID=200917 RepID=A0A9P0LXX9_ACAOB|nr:unnamed protein product [Acanthoscelides obtectus]CAK1634032.1 hypothetical protein AOBTE_LOCUS8552 [Acanthoscelides obtectus]